MSEHTPGPWSIRVATGTCDREISGGKVGVAVVPYKYATTEMRAANARLIAAAPKLLLATKTMIEAAQIADEMLDALGKEHDEIKTAIRLAQKLVAEAEGHT